MAKRKPIYAKPRVQLFVRLTPRLKAQLVKRAEEKRVSLSHYVAELLVDHVRAAA